MTESVVFYWRPGCPFCIALRAKLTRRGVSLDKRNIWEDADAAARVREVAGGNETVPTVVVGGTALVNPGVKQVLGAISREAPELRPPAKPRRGSIRRLLRRDSVPES
jgi:glutaredoxin